ncbi:MAG: hypothetical protein ACOC0D_01940 [Spirochaeta sp.]
MRSDSHWKRVAALMYTAAIMLFAAHAAVGAEQGSGANEQLHTARRLLVQAAEVETRPTRFLLQELRGNGEVRESLEVIPDQGDGEAEYRLNGTRIDPETDSLGRFDSFADMFTDESDEDSGDPEDATPRFETLQGTPDGSFVTVNGRRTEVWDIEFDTRGGDVNSGSLYLLPGTGVPVRLTYDADTPMFVSAATDSFYRQASDGSLERRLIEIRFRIGALFLSRTYRIVIDY